MNSISQCEIVLLFFFCQIANNRFDALSARQCRHICKKLIIFIIETLAEHQVNSIWIIAVLNIYTCKAIAIWMEFDPIDIPAIIKIENYSEHSSSFFSYILEHDIVSENWRDDLETSNFGKSLTNYLHLVASIVYEENSLWILCSNSPLSPFHLSHARHAETSTFCT